MIPMMEGGDGLPDKTSDESVEFTFEVSTEKVRQLMCSITRKQYSTRHAEAFLLLHCDNLKAKLEDLLRTEIRNAL